MLKIGEVLFEQFKLVEFFFQNNIYNNEDNWNVCVHSF